MRSLAKAIALVLLTPVTVLGQGMPGLLGPDHIGLTVPDVAEATAFFTDVLGCKSYFSRGPVKLEGDWMKENLNVHPRAEIKIVTFIRCGHGSNIELFEFRSPEQNAVYPANSDIGGHHISFLVRDIKSAATYLKTKGVKLLGDTKTNASGPTAGASWVYFVAPWGTQFELRQTPDEMPYEREFGPPPLWSPAKPAE